MPGTQTADTRPYKSDVERGFGHHGAMRNGARQAVRPRGSYTWDLFENGRCIATGLSEQEARDTVAR